MCVCVYICRKSVCICMYMKKTHGCDYIYIFIEQKTLSVLSEPQWGMQNNLQSHATGIKFDSECITKHHSQCYSLLQLKTSGLKIKFLSITLEFAAELNVVRAPFLRHHYLLTSARQVERLAPPTAGSALCRSETHSWITEQLCVNILKSPHYSAVKMLT